MDGQITYERVEATTPEKPEGTYHLRIQLKGRNIGTIYDAAPLKVMLVTVNDLGPLLAVNASVPYSGKPVTPITQRSTALDLAKEWAEARIREA